MQWLVSMPQTHLSRMWVFKQFSFSTFCATDILVGTKVVYRFDIIWICNQSQNKRWSKSIIKTCADQNQSQNMRWSKANIRSICVPQSSLFILIYDPTRINKATLSVLISGNLLLRQSQKSIDIKITVHTYKDTVKKMMDRWYYLLNGRPPWYMVWYAR